VTSTNVPQESIIAAQMRHAPTVWGHFLVNAIQDTMVMELLVLISMNVLGLIIAAPMQRAQTLQDHFCVNAIQDTLVME